MEDLKIFEAALDGVCTSCSGTGRDGFTEGVLWCGACQGKGTREAQRAVEKEDRERKARIDELLKK